MLHAFIDTNIYLGFYAFAGDDLQELRKLRVAVETGELCLWSTTQLDDELLRNREGKIAESLKGFLKDLRPPSRFPQLVRSLPDFADLQEKHQALLTAVAVAEAAVQEAAGDRSLQADTVLQELLDVATAIEVTPEIVDAARDRSERGNPPGKRGSLGDAIHWECLLDQVPEGDDLHLVTGDGDFLSALDDRQPAEYLRVEWAGRGTAEMRVYRTIGEFLREHFPDIRVVEEFEKELLIRRLVSSGTFAETHRAIVPLESYSDFTDEQATDLLNAAVRNSQINFILVDSDVRSFFRRLYERQGHLLSRLRRASLADDLGLAAPVESVESDDDAEPTSISP